MQTQAAAREHSKAFRRRNRLAGLCQCGRKKREPTIGCPTPKTCDYCYTPVDRPRLKSTHAPARVKRAWTQLHTEHDPATVSEWVEFCREHDMPLVDALEDAMDLYIALARREDAIISEAEAAKRPDLRLVG